MISSLLILGAVGLIACAPPPDEIPTAALELMERGRSAAAQQRYTQALALFDSAHTRAPALSHLSYFESGNIYARLGQSEQAANAYTNALAAQPEHAESKHNLAVLRADQGDLPQAISLLQQLYNYSPALSTLALFYTKKGDYINAGEALQRALALAPHSPDLHRQLGALYMQQGLYDKAEQELIAAWQVDSTHVETARLLGQLHVKKRMPERALPYFLHALDLQPMHVETHYNMAIALAELEQRDQAQAYMQRFEELAQRSAQIAQLRRSLDSTPNDIDLHLQLASQYTALGQIERAGNHYRAILMIDSLHMDTLVRLSSLLLRQGAYDESSALCHRGIAAGTDDRRTGSLYFTSGYIHMIEQRYTKAERDFLSALNVDAKHAEAWNNLGNLQQLRGDFTAAQHSFSQAIGADSLFVDAHFNLAILFQRRSEWAMARRAFFNVLRINPDYARAHYGLGTLYEAMDSTQAALQSYRVFLERDRSDSDWRSHAEQRLAALTVTR